MHEARKLGTMGWRLAALALVGLLAATPASAAIKCWKNKDGVRECGNAVPPEYAQQGSETKDAFGVTIGATGRAKTREELEAERAAAKEKEAAVEADKRRAAQDRVLLDTFTSEDDIVLTRDGQIAHLESQIHLVQSHIEKLQKNLDQMIDRAGEVERRGEKPNEEMVKNIDNVRGQIDENHRFIDTKRKDQDEIRARFDADLTRFRELKGIKPAAAPTATATTAATPATE